MIISRSYPTYFQVLPIPDLLREESKFVYNFFENDELEEDVYATTDLEITYNVQYGIATSEKRVYSREIVLKWNFTLPQDFTQKVIKSIDDTKVNDSLNSSYTELNLQDLNVVNTVEFKAKKSLQTYYDSGLINNNSPITKEVLDAIANNQHNFLSYIPNSGFDQLTSRTFQTNINNRRKGYTVWT
jgi:hypothetical protein